MHFVYTVLLLLASQAYAGTTAQKNLDDTAQLLFGKYVQNAPQYTQDGKKITDIITTFCTGLIDAKTTTYITVLYWNLERLTRQELATKTGKPAEKITVTASDIIASTFWQNYLKLSITALLDQVQEPLQSAQYAQKDLYKYIPDFQSIIHQSVGIHDWNMIGFLRNQIELNAQTRRRLIASCIDWKNLSAQDLNTAIQAFKSNSFYATMTATYLEEQDQQLKMKKVLIDPSIPQIWIDCFAMINIVQALCKPLFSEDKIDTIIQALKGPKPQPFFLLQDAADYPYLQLLVQVKQTIAQTGQPTLQGAYDEDIILSFDDEHIVVQDIWSDIGTFFSGVGTSIAKGAQEAWTGISTAVTHAATGAIKGIGGLLSGDTKLMKESAEEFGKATDGLTTLVTGVSDIAKGLGHGATALVSTVLEALTNSDIANDLNKALNSAVDAVVDATATVVGTGIKYTGAVFKLGQDAIWALAATVKLMVSHTAGTNTAWAQDMQDIGYDIANAFLSTLSFAWNGVKNTLNDLTTAIAYTASAIVDSLINVVRCTAVVFEFFQDPGAGPSVLWERAENSAATQWMENHKKTFTSVITAALDIAVAIALTPIGGGALGIGLAIGLGLMVVGQDIAQVAQSIQNDESTIQRKKDQQDFLNNYATFLQNTQQVMREQQKTLADEMNKKQTAEKYNMERSLGFYQSALAQQYQAQKDSLEQQVGSFQQVLLTPDSNGLTPADVGSIYGIKTNVLDLNPGQGFTLYNIARKTYSQEIAVFPEQIPTEKVSTHKFWFNQKTVKFLKQSPTTPLDVEVRLQAIYVLDTFYIGLYLGGTATDQAEIQKTGRAPLNTAHMAKMAVYKKEHAQDPVSFDIYEHESSIFTNGWAGQSCDAPDFSVGTWYRIKAQLQGSTLKIKIFQENQKEPGWTTLTVTPTNQQTIGVIFSGASVEFDLIKPHEEAAEIPALRPPYTESDEAEREKAIIQQKRALASPAFGTFVLSTESDSLLRDQYIYNSTSTNIKGATGSITDYLVFATRTDGTITALGAAPSADTNVLVSLVSGTVYDAQGRVVDTIGDIYTSYSKQHTIPEQKRITIENTKNQYEQVRKKELTGPFTLGAFTLTPADVQDSLKNIFIFQTSTPESSSDYVVLVRLDDQQLPTMQGIAYSQVAQGMISLVTGNLYGTGKDSIRSGYTRVFDVYKDTMLKSTRDKITAAQQTYQTKNVPAKQIQQVPPTPVLPEVTAQPQPKAHFGFGKGTGNVVKVQQAKNSLAEQQVSAAQGATTSGGFAL